MQRMTAELFAVNAVSLESSMVAIEPVRILDTRDPVNVGLTGRFASPVAHAGSEGDWFGADDIPSTDGRSGDRGCPSLAPRRTPWLDDPRSLE